MTAEELKKQFPCVCNIEWTVRGRHRPGNICYYWPELRDVYNQALREAVNAAYKAYIEGRVAHEVILAMMEKEG